MLSRPRALPAGFIAPCLPINAPQPPSGEQWLHEIKHDGFRIIARKDGKRVKLYSRPGNDLTYRFPLIVEAIAKLRSQSCIIDGEAVACGEDGIASFNRIRYRHNDKDVFLYAFDLIELNGDDLRRNPLIVRKTTLASALARAAPGLRLNEHLEADGLDVFHHACKLGLEGIVSKRKDSRYKSGRSPDWIKSKNPNAPAVKRLAEEEWGVDGPPQSRDVRAGDHGPHTRSRLPRLAGLLQFWPLPSQRNHNADRLSERNPGAVLTSPDGLHPVRHDWRRRSPRLESARQQAARLKGHGRRL
jgi:bifunctional non-homologous end joining protein LigD